MPISGPGSQPDTTDTPARDLLNELIEPFDTHVVDPVGAVAWRPHQCDMFPVTNHFTQTGQVHRSDVSTFIAQPVAASS